MSRDVLRRRWPVLFACLLLIAATTVVRSAPATQAANGKTWSVGILPVSAIVGVEHLALRRALESSLDTHFLGIPDVQVVDRTHVALFLDELSRSKLNRRDLQVGQIVGAEVLIASQLTAGSGSDVQLRLSAIETATGTVLLEKASTLTNGAAERVDAAVQAFAGELPERRPSASANRVDIALLPIAYTGPIDQDVTLTDGIRQRMSQALAANSGLRVLHREMGQFVLNESALAAGGLVDPKRRFAPVAGVVLVEGTLAQTLGQGKSLDESLLTLKLTVRRRGQEGQPIAVEAQTSFRDAARLEREITSKVTAAVTEITGKAGVAAAPVSSPETEKANRHWEAQRYIQEARQILRQLSATPTANDAKNQAHALDLLVRAANLLPDDPRPYVVLWQDLLGRHRAGSGPDRNAGGEQMRALRLRFIDSFPSHEMWPTAVMEELMSLRRGGKQSPEDRKASVALSERFADTVLARQVEFTFKFGNPEFASGYSKSDVIRDAAAVLIGDGQVDRGWRLSMAGAELLDQSTVEPEGQEVLNYFIVFAIHHGHLDDAWRAAQHMQTMYPGYRPINFDTTFNYSSTPIQKLRAAGQLERWQSFIDTKESRSGQGGDRNWLSSQLQAIRASGNPGCVEADLAPLAGRTVYALPGTRLPAEGQRPDPLRPGGPHPIIAMSPGAHPWCLVRMGFQEKEKLWRAGSPAMLEIHGAPQISPMGYADRHMGFPPSILEFDDAVYVTTIDDGVYRIEPSTGRATLAAPGLPRGHTSALLVHDGSLYACGGSGGDEARDPGRGFVGRLDRGATSWKVWTAPAKAGQIHDLAVIPGSGDKPRLPAFVLFHRGTLRISEFRPDADGDSAWKDAGSVKAVNSLPVGFAFSGSSIARVDELTVYRFDRAEQFRFSAAYLCPPFAAGEHYWMWDPPTWWKDLKGVGGGKPKPPAPGPVPPWQVAVPVSGSPNDIAADPAVAGRFWIADKFGGLSVLDEAKGVAGPFKVASHCFRLKVGKESVCINTGAGVIEIPRTSFDRRLAEADAWRRPEQAYATAMDRLSEWASKLPPATRGVYFGCVRQIDLAEQAFGEAGDAVPAAALPQRLSWLSNGKKHQRALELIEPYVRDVKLITEPELESQVITTLQQAGEWKRLDEFIPRLWRESPLRGAAIDVSVRTNAYIYSRKQLVSSEAYQRELAEILAGKLPETPWKWDENPVYRCFARDVRRWARLASPKRPPANSAAK